MNWQADVLSFNSFIDARAMEDTAERGSPTANETPDYLVHHRAATPGSNNPFRNEPRPAAIWMVKRFGVVGLVLYSVAAGVSRVVSMSLRGRPPGT
jgi:hypothetical protein